MKRATHHGFTLIELITVIVVLSILSAIALPRFIDLQKNARIATLQGVQGAMRSAVAIAKVNALANGISSKSERQDNGYEQSSHLVFMEGFSVEVGTHNLCPQSQGQLGSAKDMYHFINLTDDDLQPDAIHALNNDLQLWYNNQYTIVGYEVPRTIDTGPGCYIVYDSTSQPNCTIELVTNNC